MTLTEFLLARIAEDEADPDCGGVGEYGSCDRWSERRLAECEAKRAIVAHLKQAAYRNRNNASDRPFRSAVHILKTLALPYASHPSYDPAWRP
jgi:hypothetical protein